MGLQILRIVFFLVLYLLVSILKQHFSKKAPKEFAIGRTIRSCIAGCFITIFLFVPVILFPEYKQPAVTGAYAVESISLTYTDTERMETYSENDENRKVTVQFWYPEDANEGETFPLIIFSHGAFGYRMSNYSTFMELASNGYVVCSIDHPYHAFLTDHTDGTNVIADFDFLNDAMTISDKEESEIYKLSAEWLELRVGDMELVLDTIIEASDADAETAVYTMIDTETIGLSGHSLGGATAAQVGRIRSDISAVICIDGTMLGEAIGFENEAYVLNQEAYPVPLLNLYGEVHFEEAMEMPDYYQNTAASANAIEAYDIGFAGAGHLNFTDLPLVSPVLASLLGTGNVNAFECVETMNEVVLQFFNYTLKDGAAFEPQGDLMMMN